MAEAEDPQQHLQQGSTKVKLHCRFRSEGQNPSTYRGEIRAWPPPHP